MQSLAALKTTVPCDGKAEGKADDATKVRKETSWRAYPLMKTDQN